MISTGFEFGASKHYGLLPAGPNKKHRGGSLLLWPLLSWASFQSLSELLRALDIAVLFLSREYGNIVDSGDIGFCVPLFLAKNQKVT